MAAKGVEKRDPDEGYTPDARVRRQLQRKLGKFIEESYNKTIGKKIKAVKDYVHPSLKGKDTANLSLLDKFAIIGKKDVKKEIEAWKTAPKKHKEFLLSLLDSTESEGKEKDMPKSRTKKQGGGSAADREKQRQQESANRQATNREGIFGNIFGGLTEYSKRSSLKLEDDDSAKKGAKRKRGTRQEGGSMMLPPELEQTPPEDTYTPEDQANAEETQVPDGQMESEFVDFVLGEALNDDEQTYLMGALEEDPRLSTIFDKVVETASEFTGEGPVEGPGTGVSDSIPARLSDGEFVITKKATDQIGADNLQSIMDEAERAYDGGLQGYALGGTAKEDKDVKSLLGEKDEEEIKKQMISANRMPSVISS